jgi:hypothetical protein
MKVIINERRARAEEKRATVELIAEENKIMMMYEFTKKIVELTTHGDLATKEGSYGVGGLLCFYGGDYRWWLVVRC